MNEELRFMAYDPGSIMVEAPGAAVASLVSGTAPNHKSEITNHKSGEQIAKDFESVLLTKLFDQVQESIGRWDLEEDGTSSQVQGLFWFCLAREVADQGGLGLWKDIYQQLPIMDGAPNPADVLNEEL